MGADGARSGTLTLTSPTQTLAVSGGSNLGSDAHWRWAMIVTYQGRQASAVFDVTRQ